jgi:hypothetical protein
MDVVVQAFSQLQYSESIGEVPEWSNGLDSKSSVRSPYRGFESHPLRQINNPPTGGFFICLKGVLVEATAAERPVGSTKTPGAFLHERSEPEGRGTGRYPVIPPSPPNKQPANRRVFYLPEGGVG